jgi:4-hydroxy-tetrahydrodipicolinate synthase
MLNGGAGTISATANVNPAAIHDLYARLDQLRYSGVWAKRRTQELGTSVSTTDLENLQTRLNVVRQVFSDKKFPSMIAALKQAIANDHNDPQWTRVRPPLIELTPEQSKSLASELTASGFTMQM